MFFHVDSDSSKHTRMCPDLKMFSPYFYSMLQLISLHHESDQDIEVLAELCNMPAWIVDISKIILAGSLLMYLNFFNQQTYCHAYLQGTCI